MLARQNLERPGLVHRQRRHERRGAVAYVGVSEDEFSGGHGVGRSACMAGFVVLARPAILDSIALVFIARRGHVIAPSARITYTASRHFKLRIEFVMLGLRPATVHTDFQHGGSSSGAI